MMIKITRYGEWFVVSALSNYRDRDTGALMINESVFGSFRDQSDAHDLWDTLRSVEIGDLKPEEWYDSETVGHDE